MKLIFLVLVFGGNAQDDFLPRIGLAVVFQQCSPRQVADAAYELSLQLLQLRRRLNG